MEKRFAVKKKSAAPLSQAKRYRVYSQSKNKNNAISYIDYPIRIYYIGRLDKDSEGLLLLTNQGELVNKMMRAGNCHEKEYLVTVDKPVTEDFIKKMSNGVPVLGTVTRKCRVEKTGEKTFRIILTQGLNRQIRRMCEYLGYRVKRLKRIRVMNLELGDLPVGQYREADKKELEDLKSLIQDSSETTVIRKMNGGKGNMDKTARTKELIPLLNEAAKAYYQEDREIMSNFEYDKRYDELVELERRQG